MTPIIDMEPDNGFNSPPVPAHDFLSIETFEIQKHV